MAVEWEKTTLGAQVELLTGFPFKSEGYTDATDSIRLVRGDNIIQGAMRWDGVKKWPVAESAEHHMFQLREGDVVLAMDRPWIEAGLKYAAISRYDLPCLLVQRTARLRGGPKLDTGFLRYLIGSPEFTQHIQAITTGTAVPHISGSQIKDFAFMLPPLVEQKAIATALRALDDKIELNRRMNATLEAMARTLFQSWFVDFDPVRAKLDGRTPAGLDPTTAALFPNSFHDTKVGHVPVGWQLGRLSDLCRLKRGHDLPTNRRTVGAIPVISSSGISGTHTETSVRGPGVVTGRYGTIGKVFYVETDYWPLNTTLYVEDFKGNPPRFIFHALGEVDFTNYTDKAAVPGVNRNHLHEEPTVIPSMEVRQAFARIAAPLWLQHAASERQSHTLASLRDSLLPKLLSGELSIN